MLSLLFFAACTPDVRPLYEEEKVRALAVAIDAPTKWEPDLVVAIGEGALGSAVDAAASAALEANASKLQVSLPLGAAAELKPQLRVTRADLGPGQGCESCLHFDLDIRGDVKWGLGSLGGSFPVRIGAAGQLQIVVEKGTQVVARPFRVGKVEVSGGDFGALRVDPSSVLQDYVRAAIGEALPPVPLVDLAKSGLPVRLVRIKNGKDAVRIEALTDVPGARPAIVPDPGKDGILVGVSETAATGLIRRAAFEKGLLQYNVAVDPRSLDVEGETFALGLRVWRLEGRGWWRDYDVKGDLRVADGKLQLQTDSRLVKQVDASPGAGLADPLAALLEGQFLQIIAEQLTQTLPAARREDLGLVGLRATADKSMGLADTLLFGGEVRVVRSKD